MTDELQKIVALSREAGKILMRHRETDLKVERKSDASPVTAADRESNDFIVKALKQIAPNEPVIAEESDMPSYESRKDWGAFWLVDPLDGTKEYIRGLNEFTVNIARIENGCPVLGVIFVPALDTLYAAEKGGGAWVVEAGKAPRRLCLGSVRAPYRVVISRSHSTAVDDAFLSQVRIKETVRAGSSLKFAALAEGRADLYPRFTPCMEWDVAAGDALYRYARQDGENPSPLKYNKVSLLNRPFVIGQATEYQLPKSGVILLTGYSGAGKSTVAKASAERLKRLGYDCQILDGDEIRARFPQTDFSKTGRIAHLLRAGAWAAELEAQGKWVILSMIAPYRDARAGLGRLCERFSEVHLSTSLQVCEQRDEKGLYAKARAGEIKNFTGIDDPYEVPKNPDLSLDTATVPVEGSVLLILEMLAKRLGPTEG